MNIHFQNILDIMTAADGGVKFIKIKIFLDSVEIDAEAGDPVAIATLDFVKKFSDFLEVMAT